MATSFAAGLAIVSGLAMAAMLAPERAADDGKAAAARRFVASLSESERAAALHPLDHPERTKWYFARGGRAGLFLRDMDDDTRAAALALVDAMLSPEGREQWRLIRATEALNAADEKAAGASPPTYGDDLYAVHFFGAPDAPAWAFEIEGHHFVLHAAFADGTLTVTPAFTGAFPVAVPRGPDAGKRPLGPAVEVAFELARSLDGAQRAKARIMDRPPADVLWAIGADAKAPEPQGVARGEMSDAQKALLDRLLAVHAGVYDAKVAEAQLRAWRRDHAGEIVFAFVGDTDLAKPHYYRLATPCFTIEYDSTNADASHVHCVWSDPKANFGGDALRAHLRAAHAPSRTNR
ncbi:MAG: DUF3500 domain-containing protein [Planctomycetota bacterium]